MVESLVLCGFALWFLFYLTNHSDLFAPFRNWLLPKLPATLAYVVQCSLCFSWWIMLAVWFFAGIPLVLVFTVPPFVLFLNLAYLNLKGVCED